MIKKRSEESMNIYGLGALYGWNGGLGYGSFGYGNFGYNNLGYGGLNYSAFNSANLNYLSSLYDQSKNPDSVNLSNVRKSAQAKQNTPNAAQARRTGVQHNTTRTTQKERLLSEAEAASNKTYYPSFQSVLAASMKGQDFIKSLTAPYPNIKCQVVDTAKIDNSLWQRNDYLGYVFIVPPKLEEK